jgi:signal transduction histidine kinase
MDIKDLSKEELIKAFRKLQSENQEIIRKSNEMNDALRKGKEELKINYAILHSVLESSQNIIIFSLDCNYCYMSFTSLHQQTIKKIWGVDIKIGMNMLEVIHDLNDREHAKSNFDRTLKGESLRFIELYGDPKLYRTYYENIYNPIIDSNGDIIGLAVFVVDVTELKYAEAELKMKNEELVKTNAEKDKFFSIVAHDLRSPFLGFLGLTQIMAEDASSYTVEELARFGNNMHQTANNLFKLLKNLLEWSQMQNGSFRFEPKICVLKNVVSECINMVERWAIQKGITILGQVSAPIKVWADENMIKSVLLNLLSNAVKFTVRGGRVTIDFYDLGNGMVEISVSDTGVGMNQDYSRKLFVLGEKISSKGTNGELGTGLGLLLCKEFVAKNGGTIRVESKEGVGSTFIFSVTKYFMSS